MHCKHQLTTSTPSDTLLISNKPRIPINQHPVAALINLIEKSKLESDVLICPGDLGDRADEQGISTSWTFLEEIKLKINAKILIGIPGNHDVNSRNKTGTDPFAFIKNFHENFPFKDKTLKSKFWDLGYCIIKHQESLILLVNTVHDHTNETNAQQASLSAETLEHIEKELSELEIDNFKYKICVLHHHPIKHSNIQNWKDTDSVENGDKLISMLSQFGFNMVIHGHKHQPRIMEYSSLPIFATGSFASFANLQGTGIQTMFHIIELDESSRKGVINSWEYDIINGWSQKHNPNFPPRIGFGANPDLPNLANKINEMFILNGKRPLLYDDLIKSLGDLLFLIPDKLVHLDKILKNKYQIKAYPEYPLDPVKISELIN